MDRTLGDPTKTTLTEFFALCQVDDFAKTLLYVDVPEYYTWNNKSTSLGRGGNKEPRWLAILELSKLKPWVGSIPSAHVKGECSYLCLLLHNVKGPQSFAALKTVDGVPSVKHASSWDRLKMTTSITWLWKRQ